MFAGSNAQTAVPADVHRHVGAMLCGRRRHWASNARLRRCRDSTVTRVFQRIIQRFWRT